MSHPLISICIPSYKRTAYLKRVLDSAENQTFRSFEVIITDDTPDDSIRNFLSEHEYSFPINYIHNTEPKGTPLNWMEGIKYAKGDWIKIIHDDDWLRTNDSLETYALAIRPGIDCFFSGYKSVVEKTGIQTDKTISQRQFNKIAEHPYYLFASNKIGPPSVVMFHKKVKELYDPALKWLVDLEAYVRILLSYQCVYINQPLICMSYNDTQVTNDCIGNPDIEIKEALIYYKKNKHRSYCRLLTYDAWWRLLRNLSIRTEAQLKQYAHGEEVPVFLTHILFFQQNISSSVLKIGVCSKLFMVFCYIVNYRHDIHRHH